MKKNIKKYKNLIPCPICNNKGSTLVCSYDDKSVIKCSNCEMMYRIPYNEILKDKCQECADKCFLNVKDYLPSKIQYENNNFKRIKKCVEDSFSQKKVLELSPGVGALATLIIAEGGEYKGLESSTSFYNLSAKTFPGLKDKVTYGDFDLDKHFENEVFDLIIAIDILEFIPNPVLFLKQLKKHLKQDGILFIEIPDQSFLKIRSLIRKILRLHLSSPLHPGHINFFTKKTFAMSMEKAGYEIIKMFRISLIADPIRMKLTLRKELTPWLRAACNFFKFSKLDILLQLNNWIYISRKIKK